VPASLLILVFTGWFIGMQNSIFPMIVSIAANIFNLGFNFYFVYSLGMKSNGVAYGTLISQYISLLIIFVFFYVYYKKYLIKIKKDLLFNIHKFKAFLNVNSDIFIRTLGIIFVFSFFTIQSANIGDTALATNSVLFQFFILFSYLLDGFANAAEAIIGDAVGKKSRRELILATKKLFLWGLGFSGIFTVGYALIGEFILKMLTDLEPVLKMAKDFYWSNSFKINAKCYDISHFAGVYSTLLFYTTTLFSVKYTLDFIFKFYVCKRIVFGFIF
jgi:MATE family multidrug resistance protein